MIAIDFAGKHGTRWAVYETDRNGEVVKPIFVPHPKQIKFFDSKKPRVLFGGGRGGGKTEAIIWKTIYTAYLIPGCKMVCFRSTMGELKKTIIQRFLDLPVGLYSRCTEDAVKFENGSVLWFGSGDEEKAFRKMLSGEYVLVVFDEWSEFERGWWKFVEGSVRTTISHDVFGNKITPQIVGATNPGGKGGEALNLLFGCSGEKRQVVGEDKSLYDPDEYEFIQSLVGDNPAYGEDTDAGKAYRKTLASQPRRIQAAWIYGRWDGFVGQYFDCLDESATSFPHDWYLRLIRKQHWAPRWISIDWGMTHHASVGWHALVSIAGHDYPITYCTYLNRGIGEAALAEEICDLTERNNDQKKIAKVYLSPETFGENSYSRARRIGDVFASRGLPRPVSANNKREDGWRLMHDLLRQRHTNIQVFPEHEGRTLSGWLLTDHTPDGPTDPPHPIQCLAQAVCDPKKDGDVLKEGDAVHLDINDQLRYGIASHISPTQEPFEDRVKDELSLLPVEGSSRYIRHLELKRQERVQNPGVFYVGKPRRRR